MTFSSEYFSTDRMSLGIINGSDIRSILDSEQTKITTVEIGASRIPKQLYLTVENKIKRARQY